MLSLHEQNGYKSSTRRAVAKSGLKLDTNYFLELVDGVVGIAGAESKIVGVNQTINNFASNNQTGNKAEAVFIPNDSDRAYLVDIEGGAVTTKDVGNFFKLKEGNIVDGTTTGLEGQLELIKYISPSKGVFKIA